MEPKKPIKPFHKRVNDADRVELTQKEIDIFRKVMPILTGLLAGSVEVEIVSGESKNETPEPTAPEAPIEPVTPEPESMEPSVEPESEEESEEEKSEDAAPKAPEVEKKVEPKADVAPKAPEAEEKKEDDDALVKLLSDPNKKEALKKLLKDEMSADLRKERLEKFNKQRQVVKPSNPAPITTPDKKVQDGRGRFDPINETVEVDEHDETDNSNSKPLDFGSRWK